jgi:hypothetical protein
MNKKKLCVLPISLTGLLSPIFIDKVFNYSVKNNIQILTLIYFISWLILFGTFEDISKFLVTKPLYITDVEFNDKDLDEIIYLKSLQAESGLESLTLTDKVNKKSSGSINLRSIYRMETLNDDGTLISISNLAEMHKFNYLIKIYTYVVNTLLALFLSFISTYLFSQTVYQKRSWFEITGLIGGNISSFITLQSLMCKCILTCCGKFKEKYKEDLKIKVFSELENGIVHQIPSPSSIALNLIIKH